MTPEEQESDLGRLGNSDKWPEVSAYIDERIESYQKYFPGGGHIQTEPELAAKWWPAANAIVMELQHLKVAIETNAEAARNAKRPTL